jgi:3-isopropylmalate/(R)-2-methylmalate dehydratase large subunit
VRGTLSSPWDLETDDEIAAATSATATEGTF